jgi:acyl-coenzyme A synthetase/AMP-(fatty) acid ligase
MTNFYDDIDAFGDATAIITQDAESVSYRELARAADALKDQLDKRCLVFCVCQNNLESIAGYVGMLRARAVPTLIGQDIHPELFLQLMLTYRPQYVWVPADNAFALEGCLRVHTYGNYVLLKTSCLVDYQLHDDLAQLLTTSGSTGSQKLVRQSYRNIDHNTASIAQYLGICRDDRPITTLPMSYTYGLSIINSHLLKGCSIILNNYTLMEKAFWELLKTQGATTFGGVPYVYEMLKKLRFSRMDLPSLRTITQAGGKLRAELVEEFATVCETKGINFVVMYGQTEATARMSYLPSAYAQSKPGSIGVAIPGGRFWLEDASGQVIDDHDVVGELVYQGANVSMGYASSCADLGKGDENLGVLRTGDMAKRDQDGFYYIVGRKTRFLKLFGKRVNLDEVEQLLMCAGYDCACAGEDDKLKVYLAGEESPQAVKSFITERTGIIPLGYNVILVDAIPRNEAGKILYATLN